ncbi:YceI family protein [Algoriphagus sp. AK58]|uniref:YceI family protein n=1 Tax=Algoriphagus sp. AK58 TaxID=1406877 RepID=UPI00164F8E42|nr:YceI family protein [Algoriphagus sp. AK58]MBC6365227.1 YceI family protein [Algoriphagus sp. AK58]
MKSILTLSALLFFLHVGEAGAQTLYGTSSGEVSFFSDTPLETIEAVNKKSGAIINTTSQEIAVQMKITDFVFPNKLMQEHFNENYMESEKYPTASFKGKIKEQVDLSKAGTYPVTAEGSLSIHGVTKPVTVKGTIISSGNDLKLDFKFQVKPEEYKIEVPSLVITKIAELIDVSGKMTLVKK